MRVEFCSSGPSVWWWEILHRGERITGENTYSTKGACEKAYRRFVEKFLEYNYDYVEAMETK